MTTFLLTEDGFFLITEDNIFLILDESGVISGTADIVLPALVVSASGNVINRQQVGGTYSPRPIEHQIVKAIGRTELPGLSIAASGSLRIAASGAVAFGAIRTQARGVESFVGNAAVRLPRVKARARANVDLTPFLQSEDEEISLLLAA